MKFTPAPIGGAFVIDIEPKADPRGFFARVWCEDELRAHGLAANIKQCSISYNERRGTLRGMHFQIAPHEEVKLVRCTAGAIYDVIVDVRESSPTRGRWFGVELSADNHRMLYIPGGLAHGFQTLADGTEVFYQMNESYHPESARAVRWDDPEIGIDWPLPGPILSDDDRKRPLLSELRA